MIITNKNLITFDWLYFISSAILEKKICLRFEQESIKKIKNKT